MTSLKGRQDKDRAKRSGFKVVGGEVRERRDGEPRSSKEWESARRSLKEQRTIGADLKDMVPVMERELSSGEMEQLKLEGKDPVIHRLHEAFPTLREDAEDSHPEVDLPQFQIRGAGMQDDEEDEEGVKGGGRASAGEEEEPGDIDDAWASMGLSGSSGELAAQMGVGEGSTEIASDDGWLG